MKKAKTAEEAVVEKTKKKVDDNGATGTVDRPEESTPVALEMDGDRQTAIPGTVPKKEKDEREPRSKGDIAADFRMAVFIGSIKNILEDWEKGRSLKVVISSSDRVRLRAGLDKFSSADELMFRVLPRKPLFEDKEPEEFGTKVPGFSVDMVERLERQSCNGFKGWQEMSPSELCKRMAVIMQDIEAAAYNYDIFVENDRSDLEKRLLKESVDLANFAFFMWAVTKSRMNKNKVGD